MFCSSLPDILWFWITLLQEIEERNLDFELQCLQRQSFYQSSQDKSCSHKQSDILFFQSFYFWGVFVLGFKISARKSRYDTDAGTHTNDEELLEDLTSQLLLYFNHWFAEKKTHGQNVGSRQSLALQDFCTYFLSILSGKAEKIPWLCQSRTKCFPRVQEIQATCNSTVLSELLLLLASFSNIMCNSDENQPAWTVSLA